MAGWDFRVTHPDGDELIESQHPLSEHEFPMGDESQPEVPIGGFVEKYLRTPEVFEASQVENPEVAEMEPSETTQVENPEVAEVTPEVATEESEMEKKKQAQLEKKRATSRAWHSKFVSAGVERKGKKQKISEGHGVVPAPSSFSSLTKAKEWFVKDWIARSDMPQSVERRKCSMEAWMASQLRADFLAGRNGIQK